VITTLLDGDQEGPVSNSSHAIKDFGILAITDLPLAITDVSPILLLMSHTFHPLSTNRLDFHHDISSGQCQSPVHARQRIHQSLQINNKTKVS
jgi:hypothetical protein